MHVPLGTGQNCFTEDHSGDGASLRSPSVSGRAPRMPGDECSAIVHAYALCNVLEGYTMEIYLTGCYCVIALFVGS